MLDPTACYDAIARRDASLDGVFFTGVKTTRIYCRPICPARTPLRKNVTFFTSAAHAQEQGFRPCLRCRPESAPESPAWLGSLASVNRALRKIDEGVLAETSVEGLAESLGMTGRHLRRLFVQHLGVQPMAVEQARRIHLAKTLLHETTLPMTEIAYAAGFGSLRRFNEAFRALFHQPPTTVRRDVGAALAPEATIRLRLTCRPPFDWVASLAEHAKRLDAGEAIEGDRFSFALPGAAGTVTVFASGANTLTAELHDVEVRQIASVLARVKRTFLRARREPSPLLAPA